MRPDCKNIDASRAKEAAKGGHEASFGRPDIEALRIKRKIRNFFNFALAFIWNCDILALFIMDAKE